MKIYRSFFNIPFLSLVLAFSFVLTPLSVFASPELYIDPAEGTIDKESGVFSIDLRIKIGSECVNAVEAVLDYPEDQIEATVVSRGKSILTLWIESPEIDKDEGKISFTGGLPGGYCGSIPGDPELTNVLATVVFQPANDVITEKEVSLEFDEENSSTYLSDGSGTKADTLFSGASYSVASEGKLNASGWLDILNDDETSPEVFNVDLQRDDSIHGGKYYVSFSTVDKGSGLSHYLVKEEDIDREGYVRGRDDQKAEFKEAESPYVLKDQTLNSVIYVKAVDHAGNERVSTLVPDEELRQSEEGFFSRTLSDIEKRSSLVIIISASLLVLIIVLLLYKRHRSGRGFGENNKEENYEERSDI